MAQAMSVKLEGVKEALEMFDPKTVKQAIRSTLDKTGTKAKQDIVGAISGMYYIKPKDVRDQITVQRTTSKEFLVGIWISMKRFQLFEYFKAFQDAAGIVVNISRVHTTHIPHAFIRATKAGWKGVMVRRGRSRYPISGSVKAAGLPGPAIAELAGAPKMIEDIKAKAAKNMEELFYQEIDARLAKKGKLAY
jgi:hypothetical protein